MPKKAPDKIGSVLRVPLSQLHPHPQNPFAVRDDSAMQELKESVSQNGVLVPAIARPVRKAAMNLLPVTDGNMPANRLGRIPCP